MSSTGYWHGMIEILKKFMLLLNIAKPGASLSGRQHQYFKL